MTIVVLAIVASLTPTCPILLCVRRLKVGNICLECTDEDEDDDASQNS